MDLADRIETFQSDANNVRIVTFKNGASFMYERYSHGNESVARFSYTPITRNNGFLGTAFLDQGFDVNTGEVYHPSDAARMMVEQSDLMKEPQSKKNPQIFGFMGLREDITKQLGESEVDQSTSPRKYTAARVSTFIKDPLVEILARFFEKIYGKNFMLFSMGENVSFCDTPGVGRVALSFDGLSPKLGYHKFTTWLSNGVSFDDGFSYATAQDKEKGIVKYAKAKRFLQLEGKARENLDSFLEINGKEEEARKVIQGMMTEDEQKKVLEAIGLLARSA